MAVKTQPPPAGTGSGVGGLTPTATKTGAYTAASGELVVADATAGTFAVTLPAPTAGRRVGVKRTSSGANAVTVSPASGLIDGYTSVSLTTQGAVIVLDADGTNWTVESAYPSPGAPGPAGPTGATGPAGGTGPTGAAGTNGAISTIQDEGTDLAVRARLNFEGAGVTAADDAAGGRTTVTIPGGGGGASAATAAALGTVKIAGTPTDPANPVARVQESADALYQQMFPGLVAPVVLAGNLFTLLASGAGALTANRLYLLRAIARQTGTLKNLHVLVGSASGNIRGSIFDTGEAVGGGAGTHTLLWDGPSVAVAGGWLKLGDPNVAVVAGQQIELGIMLDNATAQLSKQAGSALAWSAFPGTLFATPGGAPGRVLGYFSAGSFANPATITQASVTAPGVNSFPLAFAQVV